MVQVSKFIDPSTKILVADNNTVNRKNLIQFLNSNYSSVQEFENLQDVFSFISAHSKAVIILSKSLVPGEFKNSIARIKSISAKIPVIITTKLKHIDALVECSDSGADGVITLPLNEMNVNRALFNAITLVKKHSPDLDSTLSEVEYINEYKIKRIIGSGGMGVVYLVEKIEGDIPHQYALKMLQTKKSNQENEQRDNLERFLREAEIASRLIHPNIIKVHDFGITDEMFIPYIVMDYLPGQSLRYFIGQGVLNYAEKVLIIRQVADALATIHGFNICHRDIKPENILLSDKTQAKLTDFGIAKFPHSNLTQTSLLVGTPTYMSPESILSTKIDHRSDLFSLGSVAYELMVDRPPFASDSVVGTCSEIIRSTPEAPRKIYSDFPEILQCILEKLLKKDPNDRYQSATELVSDLDKYIESTRNQIHSSA